MTADILFSPCCSTSMQMGSAGSSGGSCYEYESSVQNLNCRSTASLAASQKQQQQLQQKMLKAKQQEHNAHQFQQQQQQQREALERERKQRESDEEVIRQRIFECAASAAAATATATTTTTNNAAAAPAASSTTSTAAATTTTTFTNSQSEPHVNSNANSNAANGSNVRAYRNYDTAFVRNAVAQALITRLQKWCCQLFWLTIVCVIGCCGDNSNKKTVAEVRRDIFNNSMRRCKDLNDLEVQLLRRLTSPQSTTSTVMMRPLRAQQRKRHAHLSRPPSPQLFAIAESDDEARQ